MNCGTVGTLITLARRYLTLSRYLTHRHFLYKSKITLLQVAKYQRILNVKISYRKHL